MMALTRGPTDSVGVMAIVVVVVFVGLQLVGMCNAHGRLWEPPSRSSMWRRGYNTTVNINDNELSCGGFENQWIRNGGKCGICGDPYQMQPRDNEYGGKYASGIITRTYPIGGIIDVIVGLTANHGGYFEFRLCPIADPSVAETVECLDRHMLPFVIGGSEVYKYYITDPRMEGEVRMSVKLPEGVVCEHCVLQWRYRTGSRWGCEATRCGKGEGPQEEFYGCSDVTIAHVPSVIYHDPIGTVGLNDLGSASHKRMMTSKGVSRTPATRRTSTTLAAPMPPAHGSEPAKMSPGSKKTYLDNFLADAQQIAIDAIRKFYRNDRKIRRISTARCFAAREYSHNPIIHEWCTRVCARDDMKCPLSMCTCNPVRHHREPPVTRRRFEHRLTTKTEPPPPSVVNLSTTVKRFFKPMKTTRTLPTAAPPNTRSHLNHGQMTLTPRSWREAVDSYQSRGRTQSLTDQLLFNAPSGNTPGQPIASVDDRRTMEHILKRQQQTVSTDVSFNNAAMAQRQTGDPRKDYVFALSSDVPSPSQLDSSGATLPPEPERPLPKLLSCIVSEKFAHNQDMKEWCMKNCASGFCPRTICSCNV